MKLASYLKIAFRVLMRRKFFTLISLFGIAFTMVVLITGVALFENSYSPHRPESRSDRFLTIWRARMTSSEHPGREWSSNPGYKFLDRFARDLPGAENFTIHSEPEQIAVFKDGRKIPMMFKRTDGAFWEVMDFDFLEGGPYSQADEANRNFVAVINEATRDLYFGGQPALGETIEIDGQRFRVAGVVRNVAEYRVFPYADAWAPISTQKTDLYRDRLMGSYYGTVLAESRAAIPGIKQAFKARFKDVPSPRPDRYDIFLSFTDTYLEAWAREFSSWNNWEEDAGVTRMILIAAGLVLLFMLLPAVNLINLNVSRIMERASEIGVRKAFGATSRALTWQFLTENLALTLLGGLAGLVGAWLVLTWINVSGFIPYARLHVNFTVFAAALALSTLFGVLSGVYPAWRMSKTHPATALKGGAR